MITLKPRKRTNEWQSSSIKLPICKYKTQSVSTKNISYCNLVFIEQLFEKGESFWNKLSKNRTSEQAWVNLALSSEHEIILHSLQHSELLYELNFFFF